MDQVSLLTNPEDALMRLLTRRLPPAVLIITISTSSSFRSPLQIESNLWHCGSRDFDLSIQRDPRIIGVNPDAKVKQRHVLSFCVSYLVYFWQNGDTWRRWDTEDRSIEKDESSTTNADCKQTLISSPSPRLLGLRTVWTISCCFNPIWYYL